jgi:hypothetical protein
MFEMSTRTTRKTFITNCYPSKGEMEGRPYDSTKVTVLAARRNPNSTVGLDTEILNWGTAENYKKLQHINFLQVGPVLVELEVEDQLRGKGEKEKRTQVIHDVRILQPEHGGSPLTQAKSK